VRSRSDAVRSQADRLAGTVATFVAEHRLPGAAVGVVAGDELAWSLGFGYADVESETPSSPAGLYRIASITKTVTATAIMQLRDDGRLDLDDPVVQHLPELHTADGSVSPVDRVTLRRLLSHEAGLMTDPPGTTWSSREYLTDPSATLSRASEIRTAVPPSTQTKYSNLGFQLLGEVVARRSGMPYADYVRTHVLEPLGMSSTAFDPVPSELASRRATGYAPRTFSDRLAVAEPPRPPASAVAEGGLWSCVEDLARWVSAQFRTEDGPRSAERVLSGATLREMRRPRYLSNEEWTEAFAIGWYAKRRGEEVWIQHSGGLPGFITNVCFHAREPVGAIALLNGIAEASQLSMDLGAIALDAVRSSPGPATLPAPLPDGYAPLLGLYTSPDERLPLSLEWREGRLTFISLDDPTWRMVLLPTDDPSTFVVEPGTRESGESVVFERSAGGRIHAVRIPSDRLVRLDPVERD
jgi:D-alanyl-D-alanine carboxypeptidase